MEKFAAKSAGKHAITHNIWIDEKNETSLN